MMRGVATRAGDSWWKFMATHGPRSVAHALQIELLMQSAFPPSEAHHMGWVASSPLTLFFTYAAMIFVAAGRWPRRGARRRG
jgi:hypothetical protein